MWARLSIVAGLLFGIVVAVVVFAGIVALSPGVPLPSVAAPSLPIASASPSPVASSATSLTGLGATLPRGGVSPDITVTGLKSILPGVDTTP